MVRRSGLALALSMGISIVPLCGACASKKAPPVETSASAAPVREPPVKVAPDTLPTVEDDPNPLNLPARAIDIPVGQHVFAPPVAMLRGAREGSSLAMRGVNVVGREGDNLVVQATDGPPYKVHPAYVIVVPTKFSPRVNGPVIADWAGKLRHGVLKRMNMGSAVIRFIDTEDKAERTLKDAALIGQTDGFHPGNFAAMKETVAGADTYRQVMLVSELGVDSKRWLVLGFAGAATIVDESMLVSIPVTFEPKEGANVWGLWLGTYRAGTVQAVDRPGLCTVRFDRTGRAVHLGWGSVMPPYTPDIPMPTKPLPGHPKPKGSFM